jgi:hypothetical protein
MKSASSDANRRAWNGEHARLRKALTNGAGFPGAITLFLRLHAAVHSARLQPGGGWSFQDEVLAPLSEAHWRRAPRPGAHSPIWLIWHITRIEDAAMNGLLAGRPQVLHGGAWQARLAAPFVDVGNEMSTGEMAQLSETVNVKALLAYRLAVGKRTRQIARRLQPGDLEGLPDPARLRALATDGTVPESAGCLLKYWGGRPRSNLLLMPASRHSFVHLNEIRLMTARLLG